MRAAGGATVTVNEHEAVALLPAVAVQRTFVVPTGNVPPDAGAQLTLTGATPPVAVGVVKATETAAPLVELAETSAGHVRLGDEGVTGGVGEVGVDESLHPVTMIAATSATTRTACRARDDTFLLEIGSAIMGQPTILSIA